MVQLLYILYLDKCDPSEVFRKQSAKLCKAIEADPLRVANGLHAEEAELIGPCIIKNVTTMTGTAYEKANIIVREIERKLLDDVDPVQYLKDICNFLQKYNEKTLKNISSTMKEQLI